ncbi:TPA: hypothetical protein SMR77_001469 [Pseudomonas aeruginosa]|nr:hypothetical protein [Pseudomonas aeruginosa]
MSLALSRPDSDLLARVSDFLVAEAELLDDRLLDTWFALFERAARYRVLPLQEQLAGQAPEDSLYIIDDDHVRLRERVDSILGGHTWMEQPRSRTRRLVGNVRLKRVEGELVSSREAWNFVGEASHVLRDGPEGLRIVSREIRLDHETISAQRRISIIL